MDIKHDFGVVEPTPNLDIRKQIARVMDENGFDILTCDICSVREKDDGVVLFKFVHHSVPTMETEPYYKIKFTSKDNGMKETIKRLEKEEVLAREKLDKIRNAITALQDVCEHKLEDGSDAYEVEGNDSHKTYYKCKICGNTESV